MIFSKGILAMMSALLFSGCAFMGIDMTEDRTITIVKSPYLINASGDLEVSDKLFIKDVLKELEKTRYIKHKFEPVIINVSGSESEDKVFNTTLSQNSSGTDNGTEEEIEETNEQGANELNN